MKNKTRLIIIGVIFSILLSACGSGKDYYSTEESWDSSSYANSYDYPEEAAVYESDIYEASGSSEAKLASSEESKDLGDEITPNQGRKLIKTVDMRVETREFDSLINNVEEKIKALGGYAESSSVSGNSYDSYSRRSAYIVARIPADKLDQFVTGVEKESNILSKNESAEDVTLTYSDVEAHRDSLRVEQDRLNDLLAEADSIETIIALESRLGEVRYELESYESRLRSMDNQVDYSTVNLDIAEVKEYKPEPIEDPTLGERIAEAFTTGLATSIEIIQDVIVGFVAILPVLLVIAIILGVIALIILAIVKIIVAIIKKKKNKNSNKKNNNDKKGVGKTQGSEKIAVRLDHPPVIKPSDVESKDTEVKEGNNDNK